jgi:hypothetical protein
MNLVDWTVRRSADLLARELGEQKGGRKELKLVDWKESKKVEWMVSQWAAHLADSMVGKSDNRLAEQKEEKMGKTRAVKTASLWVSLSVVVRVQWSEDCLGTMMGNRMDV